MKTCPICKARSFNDMEVCYGCLHHFERKDSQSKQPKHERITLPVHQRPETQNAHQRPETQNVHLRPETQSTHLGEKSSAGMTLPEVVSFSGLRGEEKQPVARGFINPLNSSEELLAEYQLVISLKPVVGAGSNRQERMNH